MHITRLGVCVIGLVVLLGRAASAQIPVPAPDAGVILAWDHDGANLGPGFDPSGFQLIVDGRMVSPSIPSADRSVPFPALTPGVHDLTIRAFNAASASDSSNVLSVRVFVGPAAPTNFRLVVLVVARWRVGVGWEPVLSRL